MMKKPIVIFLSVLVVLIAGQTVSAKGNIALDLGCYGQVAISGETSLTMALKLGLSGEYYFNDKVSLVGAFSINPTIASSVLGPVFEVDLDTKINMFDNGTVVLGLNTGLMYQGYARSSYDFYNDLFFNIGAHGEISFSPKIKMYGEVSIPVIALRLISGDLIQPTFTVIFGTYSSTSFTVKIGMRYEISEKVFLGINYYLFRNFPASTNRLNFNIGYSF